MIPEDEARQILGRFGAIEKLWYCSDTDKEMFRLPEGVWVMFAFFQDCRDAQAVSRLLLPRNRSRSWQSRGFEMTQLTVSNNPRCQRTCASDSVVVLLDPSLPVSVQTAWVTLHRS